MKNKTVEAVGKLLQTCVIKSNTTLSDSLLWRSLGKRINQSEDLFKVVQLHDLQYNVCTVTIMRTKLISSWFC